MTDNIHWFAVEDNDDERNPTPEDAIRAWIETEGHFAGSFPTRLIVRGVVTGPRMDGPPLSECVVQRWRVWYGPDPRGIWAGPRLLMERQP